MPIEARYPVLERPVGKDMTNYPVGDFLIRVKNAALAGRKDVEVFASGFVRSVAKVLKEERFLEKVEEKEGKILVSLAYSYKKPVIMDIKLISRPGRRIYMSSDEIAGINKPTIFLVSTPRGVFSSKKAVKERLGGEIIAEIL